MREPPFETLKRLTDEEWVGNQNQHYFMDAKSSHVHDAAWTRALGSSCDGSLHPGSGIELCRGQNHSIPLSLTKPHGGWAGDGRLRFRIDVVCGKTSTCRGRTAPGSCPGSECKATAFRDTPTTLSRVTMNGVALRQSNNVSNLWVGSQSNDPFAPDRYAAFTVPLAVVRDGINTLVLDVDSKLEGNKACISCGSAQPRIMHLDLQLPSAGATRTIKSDDPGEGLLYQGAWGFRPAEFSARWPGFSITFETGNLTTIANDFEQHRVQALYPLSWTTCKFGKGNASGCAMTHGPPPGGCVSPVTRFGQTPCATIRPDYKSYWAATYLTLKPLIASGAVIGVFLGDERMWDGITAAQTETIGSLIKSDWPKAIIYQNEAGGVGEARLSYFLDLRAVRLANKKHHCFSAARTG